MSNASDAVFRVELLLRAKHLYTQLSSIGVFGTEANTGFIMMHMRRPGSYSTFVKITRLMSDQLEIALVLGSGPSNPNSVYSTCPFLFFV
jgi:hypothetical protein